MEYDVTCHNSRLIHLPYPPGTNAFLYYSIAPEKPRIAGELRLRVVSSNDHASFESGSDLLLTNGRVWSRPLYGLSKYRNPLYEKLREERFIPDDLHAALSNLPLKSPSHRRSQVLHKLNDTFVVDFSRRAKTLFFVINEQGVERISLHCNIFFDDRAILRVQPYTGTYTITIFRFSNIDHFHEFTGSALARFERSTLPDHKGTRTVVLRFIKIITPVKCVIPFYDGNICFPVEGELYRRSSRNSLILNHNQLPAWCANIDRSNSRLRGLRLLWDA